VTSQSGKIVQSLPAGSVPVGPDVAGLSLIRSDADFASTVARLLTALIGHGLILMARIDHTATAETAGIELRPTEVFMFGSPRVGSPLMQVAPSLAIDLPLRALVWTDDADTTWVAYNDPVWIGARHSLDPEHFPALIKMASTLYAIARFAAGCEEQPSRDVN